MTLLDIVNLKKYFGETRAVDGVSFAIHPQELVALVGSNGAGKTTLVNLITGLLPPSDGKIFFLGRDLTALSVRDRIRAGIARSFQLVNLFDQLTVLDNIRLAVFARDGKIRKATTLAESDGDVRQEAMQVLSVFGLEGKRHAAAGGLAQGERKLLDVALAYALRPKFILLDEPTSGVGTREKARIMDRIASVVRSGGVTALIVEHDMDVVFRYSDRIVAMHQGRVLAEGAPDEIKESDVVAKILLGRR